MSKTEKTSRMLAEASEAPRIVARQFEWNADAVATLAERLRDAPPRFVATGARGSSDHAATFAKYLIETRLGLVTASAAPSVATIYGRTLAMEGALFLAISQSGRSPDLIDMTERAKAGGALTVALVNDPDSPLAAASDTVLPLHANAETSVAATKSYIASLSALLHLTAVWTGDKALTQALTQLPGRLEEALELDWSPMVEALVDARDLLILGRGVNLAIAQEAALKLKETCGLHSEAFSTAEVMHGPVALVGQDYPVLIFSPEDETRASVREMADTIRAQGGRVLIAETEGAADRLPIPRPLHPACDSLPMILSFYRAAAHLSVRRGLDPDEPRHLRKVTETR